MAEAGENQQILAHYALLWETLAIQIHDLNEAKVVAMTGAFYNVLGDAGKRYLKDRMRYDFIDGLLVLDVANFLKRPHAVAALFLRPRRHAP